MDDNRSGGVIYSSQPGCLGAVGQVALVVALACGLALALALLIWQAALQSPLLVGVFVVLLLMVAGAFVGVVVAMQRQHAVQLRDTHLAAASAHYADPRPDVGQAQLGPGAPERQRVDVRRNFANGLPAGMSALVGVPTGDTGGQQVETDAHALAAGLSILRDGGQPTRAEFMARGITSSADQAAAVAALVALEYAEAGTGKGSAARWRARPEDADAIAAALDDQLRQRGAALPYPMHARTGARAPAQARQAGRQAADGGKR